MSEAEKPFQYTTEPWESVEEFVQGIVNAGLYIRKPVDQVGSDIKPIIQVSQILLATSVSQMEALQEGLVPGPWMEWLSDLDVRMEDGEGKEVKFPIRIVIEPKHMTDSA